MENGCTADHCDFEDDANRFRDLLVAVEEALASIECGMVQGAEHLLRTALERNGNGSSAD